MSSIGQKVENLIRENQLKTITIDIFDTILLRQMWPEDKQFMIVAERWLPHIQRAISAKITRDKVYSWRQYARDELFRAHYEFSNNKSDDKKEFDVNLTLWFGHLIDLLSNVYRVELTSNKRQKLLDIMLAIEVETEKEYLRPNVRLINAIQRIRQQYPTIRIYFLSDMYLEASDIWSLLKHFEVDIFDGGVSSTDMQASKHSGNLFYMAHNSTSVLGDNFSILIIYT